MEISKKVHYVVEATRPYNMVSGVLLFNIGFFLYHSHVVTINYFIGIAVIILAFAFATIQNDIEDMVIDKINAPNKPITSGKLHLEETLDFNNTLLLILLGLSLYAFPNHVFFVIPALILIWSYNKPPLILSRKPIASIIILALMYSTFPLLYGYYIGHGSIDNHILWIFVFFWLILRISISILKDYKDVTGDALNNKKTFYLVFGATATAWISIIGGLIGYSGIVITLFFIKKTYFYMLLIPIGIISMYLRYRLLKTKDLGALTKLFHTIFFGQNPFDLLFLICLLF